MRAAIYLEKGKRIEPKGGAVETVAVRRVARMRFALFHHAEMQLRFEAPGACIKGHRDRDREGARLERPLRHPWLTRPDVREGGIVWREKRRAWMEREEGCGERAGVAGERARGEEIA
jgi:hypothetical protein